MKELLFFKEYCKKRQKPNFPARFVFPKHIFLLSLSFPSVPHTSKLPIPHRCENSAKMQTGGCFFFNTAFLQSLLHAKHSPEQVWMILLPFSTQGNTEDHRRKQEQGKGAETCRKAAAMALRAKATRQEMYYFILWNTQIQYNCIIIQNFQDVSM